MSEDEGWWWCIAAIIEALLVVFGDWCLGNPPCGIVLGVAVLGTMMVGLPIYWYTKECKQRKKGRIVVGYFLSFFAWMWAIILGIIGDLFAVLGVCVFLGIGIIGLIYLIISGKMKKRKEKRKKALARELEDMLKELDEQLGLGHITQEEYKQKKKKLLEKRREAVVSWELDHPQIEEQAASELGYPRLMELKEQLSEGFITPREYERKKKLLEGLTELKLQLGRNDITFEEYHQRKKKLLEKSEA